MSGVSAEERNVFIINWILSLLLSKRSGKCKLPRPPRKKTKTWIDSVGLMKGIRRSLGVSVMLLCAACASAPRPIPVAAKCPEFPPMPKSLENLPPEGWFLQQWERILDGKPMTSW